MELALKAWLVDNAVTTDDKTDQILQLESAGKVDIEAIYKEMFNKTKPSTRKCLTRPRASSRKRSCTWCSSITVR